MCGTSVRKSAAVLSAHFNSVFGQILPPNTDLAYCYVTDWPEPPKDDADAYLDGLMKGVGGTVLRSMEGHLTPDFVDSG